MNRLLTAITMNREDTLILTDKKTSNRILMIATFNTTLPPVTNIFHNRWDILKLKPHLKTFLTKRAC